MKKYTKILRTRVERYEPIAQKIRDQATGREVETKPTEDGDDAEPAEDDLTVISGIGPALDMKLKTAGIRTFHDLTEASDKEGSREICENQGLAQVSN